MTSRQHNMPFGTDILADRRVRFRLWAPGAKQVTLCLGDGAARAELSMVAEQDGWFGLVTEMATAGTRYRFRIDENMEVPDPASRFQPDDVHGSSVVLDPAAFDWQDQDWRGRPWHEAVLYELHVGTFSESGDYAGVLAQLDELQSLGITAIELMPLSDFPGNRNWGYDGVYPFAPDSHYGSPDDLKLLVQEIHRRGMMVFVDVVYNHFGPEGNYLHSYAPQFFTHRHLTPWGDGINFDGDASSTVRQFFIHNALYWLEEYHFDGLRLDAVHAIADESNPDILTELAQRVRLSLGGDRYIHLVLENDDNAARYLPAEDPERPALYDAQWNDDIHHVFHVLLTGEVSGYYADYARNPMELLGRCLTQGFAYQGDESGFRDGQQRGEPSGDRVPTAFVNFLQNHDQVGNRAFGERIHWLADPQAIRAATAVLLLAPSPPMLFMGEETGSTQPFPFFCDFGADLAAAVTEGRRREFERFPEFSAPDARERIPDPNAESTFRSAILKPQKASDVNWSAFHRELLRLRAEHVVPRLRSLANANAESESFGRNGLHVRWTLNDGSRLHVYTNLNREIAENAPPPQGELLYQTPDNAAAQLDNGRLPAWSTVWRVERAS